MYNIEDIMYELTTKRTDDINPIESICVECENWSRQKECSKCEFQLYKTLTNKEDLNDKELPK